MDPGISNALPPKDLERVAHVLIRRPRKTLDWDTPAELPTKIVDGDAQSLKCSIVNG